MSLKRVLTSWSICLSLILFSSSGLLLQAQVGTATLSGTVADSGRHPIPGVQVRLINLDTHVSIATLTSKDGIYVLAGLLPGRFRLLVTKIGFKQILLNDVVLNVQDSVSRNFILETGASSETQSFNRAGAPFNTDVSSVSIVVTSDFIADAPLNGRSYQDLLSLAPGVITIPAGAPILAPGTGLFVVNGQHSDANYFTIDGVSATFGMGPITFNNLPPLGGTSPALTALSTTQSLASVDTVQEFRVQTSGASAEFGRMPGSQIQITTRSGTNDLHGSLFEYFRNQALDANEWFANNQSVQRPPLLLNDFGGTIGGPVSIASIYSGKDRTFFFLSYEGLRARLGSFDQTIVPSLAFRQTVAPAVQPFINAYPVPNSSPSADGLSGTFAQTASNPESLDAISLRVDHNIGARAQLFARLSHAPSQITTQQGSEELRPSGSVEAYTLGATVRLSSNLLNEFRFNYSRDNNRFDETLDSAGGAVPFPENLLVPPQLVPSGTATGGDFGFDLTGTSLGFGPGLFFAHHMFRQQQYAAADHFILTRGQHTFKFGLDFRRLLSEVKADQYTSTVFFNSVTDLQQGIATVFVQSNPGPIFPTFVNLSLWTEDHWKIAPRFVLDYGLRWELNPAPGASNGIFPPSVTQLNSPTLQVVTPGVAQYATTYKNLAPRIGFAYQLNDNASHPVLLRAGGGLYYDLGQASALSGYAGPPFVFGAFSKQINNVSLPIPAATLAPPPVNLNQIPPGDNVAVTNPHLRLPRTAELNISVEAGLSAHNTLTLAGVGNISWQQIYEAGSAFPVSLIGIFLPADLVVTNGARSHYSGLQLQDRGYILPGLQFIGVWTWSHALDDFHALNVPKLGPETPGNSNSDADVRHSLSGALNYQVPGSSGSGWKRRLTHDWLFGGHIFANSGYPINVFTGDSPAFVNPGVPLYFHDQPHIPGGWRLNPAAFSFFRTNPSQGVLGFNSLHGPAFWDFNAALQRTFEINHRWQAHVRLEAFNVFNHPNFSINDSDLFLGSPFHTFGMPNQIQTIGVPNFLYATGAARSLELSLGLQF